MSREVFRVPLGFNWPIGKVWWGYQLDRPACGGCKDGKVSYGTRPQDEPDEDGLFWCPFCDGEGQAIVEVKPPTGEAYQVWETTSNGAPISPAFAAPEELATWLADNGASAFGGETASYEEWLAFVRGER